MSIGEVKINEQVEVEWERKADPNEYFTTPLKTCVVSDLGTVPRAFLVWPWRSLYRNVALDTAITTAPQPQPQAFLDDGEPAPEDLALREGSTHMRLELSALGPSERRMGGAPPGIR